MYRSWFVDFEPFDGSKPSNWKNGRLKDVLSLQRSSIKAGENTSLPYLPIDIIPMNTFGLSDVKPNEEAQSSLITFSKDDIVIGAMRVYFHRVIIAPLMELHVQRVSRYVHSTQIISAFLCYAVIKIAASSMHNKPRKGLRCLMRFGMAGLVIWKYLSLIPKLPIGLTK